MISTLLLRDKPHLKYLIHFLSNSHQAWYMISNTLYNYDLHVFLVQDLVFYELNNGVQAESKCITVTVVTDLVVAVASCRLAATAFLSHSTSISTHSSSQTRANRSVILFLLSFPFFFLRLFILIIFISLPRHRYRALLG